MAQQIAKPRESNHAGQPTTETIGKTRDGPAIEPIPASESLEEEEQTRQSDQDACEECGGSIIQDGVDRVCGECGLVVESTPISRRKRRELDHEFNDATRCGGSGRTVTRHDRGLATKIGHNSDLRKLSGKKRGKFYRLRRHHNSSRFDMNDRRRTQAFTNIKRITASLDLPEYITEQACVLFRKSHERSLLQGRSTDWFAAASVYTVSRCASLVRTTDEIAEYAQCSPSEIQLAYSEIQKTFGVGAGPVSPQEHIPRYASLLDLSYKTQRLAEKIAGRIHETGEDTGRSPSGMAGACLLLAADATGEKFTQAAASDVADVSPGTIRKSRDHLLNRNLGINSSQRSGGATSVAKDLFENEDSKRIMSVSSEVLGETGEEDARKEDSAEDQTIRQSTRSMWDILVTESAGGGLSPEKQDGQISDRQYEQIEQ